MIFRCASVKQELSRSMAEQYPGGFGFDPVLFNSYDEEMFHFQRMFGPTGPIVVSAMRRRMEASPVRARVEPSVVTPPPRVGRRPAVSPSKN